MGRSRQFLYAPYWDGSARANLGGGYDSDPIGYRAYEFVGPGNAKTLTCELVMKVERSKKPRRSFTAKAEIEELCNFCYEPDEIIGLSFFNNHRHSKLPKYQGIKDPEKLKNILKLVDKTDDAPIGMYCVACRARVIGLV